MNFTVDSNSLHELLQSIVSIPHEEWKWLQAGLGPKQFEAGEELFRPGSSSAGIHFIRCGLVRYFYSNEEGEERNHAFASEGNLVGCFPVIADGRPCPFTVEALERTETILISSESVKAFDSRHPCWTELQTRLMAHVALRKAAREEELLLASPEQRYRKFLSGYAELAARIPQYHVASYVGVTPVGLSRIRKRINPG